MVVSRGGVGMSGGLFLGARGVLPGSADAVGGLGLRKLALDSALVSVVLHDLNEFKDYKGEYRWV